MRRLVDAFPVRFSIALCLHHNQFVLIKPLPSFFCSCLAGANTTTSTPTTTATTSQLLSAVLAATAATAPERTPPTSPSNHPATTTTPTPTTTPNSPIRLLAASPSGTPSNQTEDLAASSATENSMLLLQQPYQVSFGMCLREIGQSEWLAGWRQ